MTGKQTALTISLFTMLATATFAQNGPGPRPGPPPQNPPQQPPAPAAAVNGATPIQGLTQAELAFFQEGVSRFSEIDSVSGTQPGATGVGLGPRFNLNSCAGCHAHPSVGGSSPAVNPQIPVATSFGASNTIPAFVTQNGPVRVARFVKNADGTPDGGVHDLFTIAGRSDAAGCRIAQPDFATAAAQNNLSLRIPTPVFGLGLVEAIEDATILAGKAANAQLKAQLGIAGHENRNGNDGTITRFGWKAQNKSLTIFGGEAYNVEQGVTNEVFPTERDETPGCGFNATPEDHTDPTATTVLKSISDVTGFTAFMKYLAPPRPAGIPAGATAASVANGQQAFAQIGCALCHTPSMTTGNSSSAALNNQNFRLYSDLLVHNMGTGLADGVTQGTAQGNEWRSAPLWGLGSRLFYLHDGRTSDLGQAIAAHASAGSEANGVVSAFQTLPAQTQRDIINFLKSL
jgi:CxxC motif-containing protein (DUF1111 family)